MNTATENIRIEQARATAHSAVYANTCKLCFVHCSSHIYVACLRVLCVVEVFFTSYLYDAEILILGKLCMFCDSLLVSIFLSIPRDALCTERPNQCVLSANNRKSHFNVASIDSFSSLFFELIK